MKKLIALLMVAGLTVSSIATIGCDSGSKAKVTETKTVETPTGDKTMKTEKTMEDETKTEEGIKK